MEVMSHASKFLLPPVSTAMNSQEEEPPPLKYALVLLNQRLPRFTPLLWDHGTLIASLYMVNTLSAYYLMTQCSIRAAKLHICADGGANRLFDGLPDLLPHEDAATIRNRYKPDVIKGDMDSVRQDVRDFYAKLGTKIVDKGHDQDTTDLHKCVTFVRDYTPPMELNNLCILVAGATGGRFDHEMGNINVLCHFPTTRIILLSDDCLIFLLPKTHRHEIFVQPSVEGPHCGLIPIGMSSESTTTTGLQWNLTSREMRFGGLVSTSNIAKEEKITVQSDSDLLWTISIKSSK